MGENRSGFLMDRLLRRDEPTEWRLLDRSGVLGVTLVRVEALREERGMGAGWGSSSESSSSVDSMICMAVCVVFLEEEEGLGVVEGDLVVFQEGFKAKIMLKL